RSWASGLESRCVLGGRGQLAHRLPEFVQLCDLRAVRLRDRERNPHIADLAQKVLLAPPEVGVAELGPIQKELSRLFGEVVHAVFELTNELIWGEIHGTGCGDPFHETSPCGLHFLSRDEKTSCRGILVFFYR